MIHPGYLVKGREIKLPEVSQHLENQDDRFIVADACYGGMGVCVKLQQASTALDYALKSVRPEYIGDKDSTERFFDELKVWLSASACSLVAEAIAVVSVNESPCVLAPWMKGGDLSNAMAQMSPESKFETILRITRGLRWVQENLNVIHRDLKPANILLDENELALVADWGLARPLTQAFATNFSSTPEDAIFRPDRTSVGNFVGTLLYAAPEQIRNFGSIDHRADIYALGCIMFELETGHPPFIGTTREEVAHKHLFVQPPPIGSSLGLAAIVARCLKKNPHDRWTTYAELETALVSAAQKQQFSLNRCKTQKRYDRSVLGQGDTGQKKILKGAIQQKGYGIIEFDQVKKYLEEANNLIAVNQHDKAVELLAPHHVLDLLDHTENWTLAHVVSLNYALCLTDMSKRLDEALVIFNKLDANQKKPAEFYVNFSLALLKTRKYDQAADICRQGLTMFPDDVDMVGNLTLAFLSNGKLAEAQETSLQRLKLRRDLHSLDEAVSVLAQIRDQERDANLPGAIKTAMLQADLLYEGRRLNPNYPVLIIKEIRLHRFASNPAHAAKLCNLVNESNFHHTLKEIAYLEMLEILAEAKSYDAFFENIDPDVVDKLNNRDKIITLYHKTIALNFMIGRNGKDGERIIKTQTCDHFLQKKGEKYVHPVMAARVLDWMEKPDEAMATVYEILEKTPNDLEAARAFSEILARNGNTEVAMSWAIHVTKLAPWKAESFDLSSYVHDRAGQKDVAQQLKSQADEVFKQETVLFEKLRTHLTALATA